MRPLVFAYEDKDNIVRLIVEIYERLVLTLSVDEEIITTRELWVKATAIITDSVSRNLKIEYGVADVLKTNYKPYHLLCKPH